MSLDQRRLKFVAGLRKLARTRESAGYTRNQLADALGVKASRINNWFCGRTLPDFADLERLEVILKELK